MLAYLWRLPLALIGLLILRSAFYRKYWGHGGFMTRVLSLAAAAALAFPLARHGRAGPVLLIVAAVLFLFPYRELALATFRARARRDLQRLAAQLGGSFTDEGESGLFQASWGEPTAREAWIGNALTHVRSLHPGVGTRQTYYMMAFVVRLDGAPPFQCSLARGLASPRYFDREWRETTLVQGEVFALSDIFGPDPQARKTGGEADQLREFSPPHDQRLAGFDRMAGTDQEAWEGILSGELGESLSRCASRTLPFEINVTPSSVNIFTTYCRYDVMQENLRFLRALAAALSGEHAAPPAHSDA